MIKRCLLVLSVEHIQTRRSAHKNTSEQEGSVAATREKRKSKGHAQDGTPSYTAVPFRIEFYGMARVSTLCYKETK